MDEREALIAKYKELERHIEQDEAWMKEVRYAFYLQSMNTQVSFNGFEMCVSSFKPDYEVIRLLDTLQQIERRIERYKFRYTAFHRFLDTLKPEERQQVLQGKLSLDLMNSVIAEIVEIETAILLRNGLESSYEISALREEKPIEVKHDFKAYQTILERVEDILDI